MDKHLASQVRRNIDDLFDKIESRDLPLPYSIDPDDRTGGIFVSWMLQEDQEGSRAVISAYPGYWKQHRASSAREPVFEFEQGDLKITLWAHPDAVTVKLVLP